MVTALELVINALRTVAGAPVVSRVPTARPPVFVRPSMKGRPAKDGDWG